MKSQMSRKRKTVRRCVKFSATVFEVSTPIQLGCSLQEAAAKRIAVLTKERFTVMLIQCYRILVGPFSSTTTRYILVEEDESNKLCQEVLHKQRPKGHTYE